MAAQIPRHPTAGDEMPPWAEAVERSATETCFSKHASTSNNETLNCQKSVFFGMYRLFGKICCKKTQYLLQFAPEMRPDRYVCARRLFA